MKKNLTVCITALSLLAALAISVRLAAQDKQEHPFLPFLSGRANRLRINSAAQAGELQVGGTS